MKRKKKSKVVNRALLALQGEYLKFSLQSLTIDKCYIWCAQIYSKRKENIKIGFYSKKV